MPVNRNALVRYKTIDRCLQNHFRNWTLQNLIDACSEALYEYEGINKPISKRTLQADLQLMRSDKLGYNAPIEVVEKKFYRYSDPNFTIQNTPLSQHDLTILTDAVEVLKQFKGFHHFRELGGLVQRLEDKVFSAHDSQQAIIDIEKNDNLRGINFLDPLYKAIANQQVVDIEYQSFKARRSQLYIFTPYLLKEYRNRWFILGKDKKAKQPLILALDRIVQIHTNATELYVVPIDFKATSYFHNAIGVTITPNQKVERVRLLINPPHTPYILTKPLHHSQRVVEKLNSGTIIELDVVHNFELEREILSFAEGITVLAPKLLVRNIRKHLEFAQKQYTSIDSTNTKQNKNEY